MEPVRGVRLIELDRITDSRGSLLAFGSESPIPFDVKNVYFILDCPPEATRAEHATSGDQVFIALNSAVTIEADNGSERASHRLTGPDTVLCIQAGVWVRLSRFSRETVVAVLSSKAYKDVEHFEGPNPTLLGVTETMIPAAAPQLRLARFSADLERAVMAALSGSMLILGERVEAFEENFAEYLAVRHCVGVNSGTDAVGLALRACGVGPGDEVITVSMTAAGTGMGILHAGAEPRFVDVDPVSRCIDPDAIESSIGPRTAAIVPVHLHGHLADISRVMAIAERHGLVVVEDCAQAHGATEPTTGQRAGSFGTAAAFSFYPTKNLGCAGDGGAVVTNDTEIARRLRALRSYAWEDERRISTAVGFNSRLDELQAAVLDVMLDHLDESNRERAQIAAEYREFLLPISDDITLPPDDTGAVHHQFAIEVDDRDKLRHWLLDRGIGTGIHFPVGLHEQPAFAAAAPPLGSPPLSASGNDS